MVPILEGPETLHALRRAVADLAILPGEDGLIGFGVASIDQALAGGLACGALHEIGPAAPLHGGAASGFALALAALALRTSSSPSPLVGEGRGGGSCHEARKCRNSPTPTPDPSPQGGGEQGVVWIQPDFAAAEAGFLYGPGLDLMGLAMERLIILRVPRARDVLWAMEEALKCRAVGAVVAEFADEEADLVAMRRLALAAREGGGFGLILHQTHCPSPPPSTAMTRWEVASVRGARDLFGGLGLTTFALSLVKNRRGRTGQWRLSWDHHERAFTAALPLSVAPAAGDGSPAQLRIRAG
jgi:protein ImuA